jgi:hypothetical protein
LVEWSISTIFAGYFSEIGNFTRYKISQLQQN